MPTTKRYAAALAGVVAALAIAAPITDAGAATTPASTCSGATAVGPTLINSVFNHGIVIQVFQRVDLQLGLRLDPTARRTP
jgi:hypothetical protein